MLQLKHWPFATSLPVAVANKIRESGLSRAFVLGHIIARRLWDLSAPDPGWTGYQGISHGRSFVTAIQPCPEPIPQGAACTPPAALEARLARSSSTFMNAMNASCGLAYGLKYLCTSPSENHFVHM